MEKIRKLHCEERLKKKFDSLTIKEVKELAGFYLPTEDDKWEVTTLWEGEGYTANTQFEAEMIAGQQMIIGLLLKLKEDLSYKNLTIETWEERVKEQRLYKEILQKENQKLKEEIKIRKEHRTTLVESNKILENSNDKMIEELQTLGLKYDKLEKENQKLKDKIDKIEKEFIEYIKDRLRVCETFMSEDFAKGKYKDFLNMEIKVNNFVLKHLLEIINQPKKVKK